MIRECDEVRAERGSAPPDCQRGRQGPEAPLAGPGGRPALPELGKIRGCLSLRERPGKRLFSYPCIYLRNADCHQLHNALILLNLRPL